jgi:predicted dehydrogenase
MKKNIAVLSTAHIHTKSYLQALSKDADCGAAYAIWDDITDRGGRYAEEFGVRFVPDLDALLADSNVDGFIICSENTRHLPLLEKALPAGKPIFCEKPLVTSREDLAAVRELLAKHPAPVFCGYYMPFNSAIQGASALLDRNALGRVTRMRCRNAHHAAYGRWFDSPDMAWFHSPVLVGGGAFMDMGTHAIHLARTLFGPVTEVMAVIENHSGQYPAVDDYGIAHLRFASGVLGAIEAGWTQTGGIGGLEITGSEKTLWNNGRQFVVGGPDAEPVPVAPGAALPAQVDRLLALLRGDIPAAAWRKDLEASIDAVAIMAAAYESAARGAWVKV